jgi:hypothetical protein
VLEMCLLGKIEPQAALSQISKNKNAQKIRDNQIQKHARDGKHDYI